MCTENCFINKYASWSKLSSLRHAQILSIGYTGIVLVPFLAYLIIQINTLNSDLSLEFPHSLFWLFIGSLSLSLGHFINEVLCPPTIDRYRCIEEYRKNIANYIKDRAVILGANKNYDKSIMEQNLLDRFKALPSDMANKISNSLSRMLGEIDLDSDDFNHTLSKYEGIWSDEDKSKLPVRIFVVLLYSFSSFVIIYLVARQFCLVIAATFPNQLITKSLFCQCLIN